MTAKNTAKNTDLTVNLNTGATVKAKPGRPAVAVTIPEKSFTLGDLQAANPTVKPVTVRAHVVRALESGTITKLAKTVKTGKRGKPAHRFILTEVLNVMKAKDKVKAQTAVTA